MGEDQRGVRLPPELQNTPSRPLEEYVRARLVQFATAFARRVHPSLSPQLVQQATAETLASLPAPDFGRLAVEHRDLQLVFRHDCLSLGCLDPQCVLCEHNPHRRCNVNFAPKYLVNDLLKAKCEAPIRVEIIDRSTGVPLGEDIADVTLEMCILDGNAYDAKCLEAGQERDDDLDACCLVLNNKAQPLLMPGSAAAHNSHSKVVVPLSRGMAQLPDLHVSDSSEAMLSGRKPPFRLLVRAVHSDGRKVNIRHAVSEGFVVATRRTRTAGKVEIPNVDDHVSKLEHMGKETVKKLQDIRGSAAAAGMDINVPDNCINKVGEFRKLALLSEADGHLRQKLQQVLKLSKEKWDDARDHAMRAVVADNRMRIWYADKSNMELGLLFTCRLGNVDLDRPVGLLQKKAQDGMQTTMEATLMAQQTPGQREQVRQLQPQAVASWWQPGHPGWAIYPVDSEQFMSTGALDTVSVPHEQVVPHGGQQPSSPTYAALSQQQAQFGGFGASNGSLPAGLTSQGSAGGYVLPLGYGSAAASSAAMASYMASQRGFRVPDVPGGKQQGYDDGDNTGPSPFANSKSGQLDQSNSMTYANLQSMFSGPLASGDLSKLQVPFASLVNFPSIPGPLPSGDLERMLQQHGGEHMMSSHHGMGKLESMELPDAVAAVAMLHETMPEGAKRHRPTPPAAQAEAPAACPAAPAAAPRGALLRSDSGLESMQSIEHALGAVEGVMDNVAEEWKWSHK